MRPDPDPQALASARFQAIYSANVDAIFRFIKSKVGQRETAEDLTAQVFMKALRSADWSREDATVRRWLFQVAQTVTMDYFRQQGRQVTVSLDALLDEGWGGPAAESPVVASEPESAITREAALAILDQLPANYRAVLHCRFIEQRTIRETALHLGISEANAKVIQLRAIKKAAELRQTLAETRKEIADGR